ncbi:MAG: DUF72 domain-containing protein [Terriglobales bacterium]
MPPRTHQSSNIRIGTSGWHYKHWVGGFYPAGFPAGKMFSWYAEHFDTVEVNNTFYRLPAEDAVVHWRQTAPPNFLFSVKASRFITHMKRLLDPGASVGRFLSRVELLGSTLGPILFQLPSKFPLNLSRLEEFLDALPPSHKYKYVFEFRDASWAASSVYQLLRRYNAALCLHDWRGVSWPREITADFTYIRFHGPTGNYSGSYPLEFLSTWAGQIRQWESLRYVFIYFNNDVAGHAVTDAKTMRRLVESECRWSQGAA